MNCINLPEDVDDEIKRHRVIRIGSCKFLTLCCYNYWTRLCCFTQTCIYCHCVKHCFSCFADCFKGCKGCCGCFTRCFKSCCGCFTGCFSCCTCFDCCTFDKRHLKMIEKGRERLRKDMNMVDIIK